MSTEQGSDPMGDMQRWLMRAGARSIGRDVAGRVRSTFGPGASKKDDVWDTATTEVLTDEPPECQWCPICRAARKYRDGGGQPPTFAGQFGGQFTGVGDTLAGLTRDAFSLFDAAMRSTAPRPPSTGPSSAAPSSTGPASTGPTDPWAAAQAETVPAEDTRASRGADSGDRAGDRAGHRAGGSAVGPGPVRVNPVRPRPRRRRTRNRVAGRCPSGVPG